MRLWLGLVRYVIGANMRVQGGTHAQGGSEAVSSACGGSADHGHRDEDTVQSVPTRRGAFAGWDAQGGELPYRRLLGDELAGDGATLLGRGPGERGGALGLAGAQVGTGTAMIYRLLQVVAARPSSIGQAGWAWRRRSNRLRLSVTRRRSCRCCCGRGASEMVALRSRGRVRGLVELSPSRDFARKNTAHAWTDGPPPATFTVR